MAKVKQTPVDQFLDTVDGTVGTVFLSSGFERELAAHFGSASLDQARIEFERKGMSYVVTFSVDPAQTDPFVFAV